MKDIFPSSTSLHSMHSYDVLVFVHKHMHNIVYGWETVVGIVLGMSYSCRFHCFNKKSLNHYYVKRDQRRQWHRHPQRLKVVASFLSLFILLCEAYGIVRTLTPDQEFRSAQKNISHFTILVAFFCSFPTAAQFSIHRFCYYLKLSVQDCPHPSCSLSTDFFLVSFHKNIAFNSI